MAKIRKNEKREMPALNTSSLPDIIFMLLFFFMTVTSMKEVTYKVQINNPQATELTKMEKKSLIRYVYVGTPTRARSCSGALWSTIVRLEGNIYALSATAFGLLYPIPALARIVHHSHGE